MKTIQIINLDGKPAAIAVDGIAHVAEHVPANKLQRVQAKALYALMVQTGDAPGPYTDAGAERYAHTAAATAARPAPRERPQPGRPRRDAHRR